MPASEMKEPTRSADESTGWVNPLEGVRTVSHETTWDEKVARGRALVTEINDRKWELGDLANEVAPASSVGVSNDDLIGRFAEEIGTSTSSLREYRRVSAAWPNATRVAFQTWTTHRMLAERDDRHEIIAEQTWTYNSLSERIGRLPNPSRVRVDCKAGEITDEPAVKPTPVQVRNAIKSDPIVAEHARQALTERPEESTVAPRMAHAKEHAEADDKRRSSIRCVQATEHLSNAARLVALAAAQMRDVEFEAYEKELLRDQHKLTQKHLDVIADILAGVGTTDWDAALAELGGDL